MFDSPGRNPLHQMPADRGPLSSADASSFNYFLSWLFVIAMVFSGLAMELLTREKLRVDQKRREAAAQSEDWLHSEVHFEATDLQWKWAKVIFPLLMAVSISGIHEGNIYAPLPFNIALWKCGFPEVLTYFSLSTLREWGDLDMPKELRLYNFLMGVAMLMHHVSSTIAFVFLLQGLCPVDNQIFSITSLVVIQHMFSIGTDLVASFLLKGDEEEEEAAASPEESPKSSIFGTLVWLLMIGGAILSEVFLQWELWTYIPQGPKEVVNISLTFFAISHLLMFAVMGCYTARKGRVDYHYLPVDAVHEEEAQLMESERGKRKGAPSKTLSNRTVRVMGMHRRSTVMLESSLDVADLSKSANLAASAEEHSESEAEMGGTVSEEVQIVKFFDMDTIQEDGSGSLKSLVLAEKVLKGAEKNDLEQIATATTAHPLSWNVVSNESRLSLSSETGRVPDPSQTEELEQRRSSTGETRSEAGETLQPDQL